MQDQWARGEFYILYRAKFTYDDALGKPHWTQLCRPLFPENVTIPEEVSNGCMAWSSVDATKE